MIALISAVQSLSILSKLRVVTGRTFRWLVADFWRLMTLVLLVAYAALTIRADGLHIGFIQIEGLKDRAHKAEADLRHVRSAQAKATSAQAAVNHKPAQISRAIAEASDVKSNHYYEQGRAAATGYAAGNSVRKACLEGGTSDAGVRRAADATAQHDSASKQTDMVALTRADFDQLTGNSLRLAQVHEDAQALIEAGVAVPVEVEPPPDLAETSPE